MFKTILNFLCLFGCLMIWFTVSASADDSPNSKNTENELNSDFRKGAGDSEEHRLTMILEDMTDVATKTRMNADFVPGMVTVLHGKDLEARGIRTVNEALRMAPGVDLFFDGSGIWKTQVRGLSNPFAYGNFKILLNNAVIDKAFWINPAPDIPIEQIERIDIIRGPASAIYGEFALSGVVDIITRKNGLLSEYNNRLFTGFGNNEKYTAGVVLSTSIFEKAFHMSLNASGSKTEGSNIQSGPDKLAVLSLPSYAPGSINDYRELETAFLSLSYMDFSLQAHLLNHGQGDFFGYALALPPYENRAVFRDRFMGVEARHKVRFHNRLNAEIKLGCQKQRLKGEDAYVAPPPGDNDDMAFGIHYEENTFRTGVDLTWASSAETKDGQPGHNLLLGWSFTENRLGNIWFESNFNPGAHFMTPETRYSGEFFGLEEGTSRMINSITFQDEYQAFDRLTITAGFRWDHYSDIKNNFSPRLGAVYHASRHHIFKAQYARAFRPPTLEELHAEKNLVVLGNPDLKSEFNDTFELGYIFRKDLTVIGASLFYSELDNLIGVIDEQRVNIGSASLKGIELELKYQLVMNILKLDANISYVNSKDGYTNEAISGAADWLSNVGLIYQPFNYLTVTLQYRHVGNRHMDMDDPRDDLSSYNTFDLTGMILIPALKGLTVRGGIKNLFDEDVRYPSPLIRLSGLAIPTYPEDFPRAGRGWWVRISYDF